MASRFKMYHSRMHRASKHGGPKTFCCTTCNKSFTNANDLKRHRKNENKQDFITCHIDLCDFKARDKNALGEHFASHQEDRTPVKRSISIGVTFHGTRN